MSEQTYGRYQLLKKLATGGMAEVFLARQIGMQGMEGSGFEKLLVIKRILPNLVGDEEFVQMFLNEARIAARFNHLNIAQIFDLGKIDDGYFLAMEYVHGEDLDRLMRKARSAGRSIPVPAALRIVAKVCEGLHYAHTKADEQGRPLKVVHRDISPQNVLVSFEGGVKLVDFGIARAADTSAKTRAGAIKGKYAYMSPEQAQGNSVDARSDLYGLGLVLYELLTGVRPLKRETDIQTLQAAAAGEIAPPSTAANVPASLDPLVMKALAADPDARYPDAQAFGLAIEDYLLREGLSASAVQLAKLMRELFSDRLEQEAKLGRPDPGVRASQQSWPAVSQAPSWHAPPGIEPPAPRRPSTAVRRAPSGFPAGSKDAARRTHPRGGMAMPEAPPRRASTGVRPRDERWKQANQPRPAPVKPKEHRRGSPLPALLAACVAAASALVLRGPIFAALRAHGGAAGTAETRPGRVGTLTFRSNLPVEVSVNGEPVGQTPLVRLVVPAGPVTVRLSSEALAIEKTLSLDVRDGEDVVQRLDFATGTVQLELDPPGEADVFAGHRKVAHVPGPSVVLSEGDYELVARNEGLGLVGNVRCHVVRDRVNFVTVHLHPLRDEPVPR